MRLIFIPGFGEDENIFEHLHPYLEGEKLFLPLWSLIPDRPRPELNAALLAKEVVAHYGITTRDVVIGHSTGGWVALFIKQIVACPVVQLASWTDVRKVVMPVPSRRLLYFLAKSGIMFHPSVFQRSMKNYHNQPSAPVFAEAFLRLKNGNKDNVVNQLRTIFNPVQQPITAMPDLRIHAKSDAIVRFPDNAVYEVPGDHFSLYTHAAQVAAPIQQLLKKIL
jgi:hypothetical protein